jgi:hypothetical protein
MKKGRYVIVCKTIALTATLAVTLYLSYSAVLSASSFSEINLCRSPSIENTETPYAAPCWFDEDESCSDCCYRDFSPQNKTFTFFVLLDRDSYRYNVCDLQIRISDSLFLAELYGIVCEERFTKKDVIYFIFRPPIV